MSTPKTNPTSTSNPTTTDKKAARKALLAERKAKREAEREERRKKLENESKEQRQTRHLVESLNEAAAAMRQMSLSDLVALRKADSDAAKALTALQDAFKQVSQFGISLTGTK